jgi:hypothetical protein
MTLSAIASCDCRIGLQVWMRVRAGVFGRLCADLDAALHRKAQSRRRNSAPTSNIEANAFIAAEPPRGGFGS